MLIGFGGPFLVGLLGVILFLAGCFQSDSSQSLAVIVIVACGISCIVVATFGLLQWVLAIAGLTQGRDADE